MRYEYKVIAGEIGNKGGVGSMSDPHSLTVHHSAVIRNGSEDPKVVAASYTRHHGGNMPYHFLIPYNDDNNIYITQYVSQFTNHNANWAGNRDALAICVDGNFDQQSPRESQLKKLKQLLDDFNSDWFKQNGWSSALNGIRPKQKDVWTYSDNKKVFTLHWHNEVAQIGHPTACCGKNLMPYVSEYRDKAGNVSWGQPVTPPPTIKPEDQAVWDWSNLYRKDVAKVFTIDTVVKGWWYPYSPMEVTAMYHAMAQQVSHLSEQLSTANAKLVSQGVELTKANEKIKELNGNIEALEGSLEEQKIQCDKDKEELQSQVTREENKNKLLKEQNEALTIANNNQGVLIEEYETKIENQRLAIIRLEKKLANCETSMTNAIQTLIKKLSDFIINLLPKK